LGECRRRPGIFGRRSYCPFLTNFGCGKLPLRANHPFKHMARFAPSGNWGPERDWPEEKGEIARPPACL